MARRFDRTFYSRDVLEVAPLLIGQHLIRIASDGTKTVYVITETEAYRGGDDLACHASKGKTPRNEVMFGEGGHLYMYLIYGMYWMMNVVTAPRGVPQAVLLRGVREASGPGRLTRLVGVDRNYNGEDLVVSERIWIEESGSPSAYTASPRVGIDYAGEPWRSMPWRYLINL